MPETYTVDGVKHVQDVNEAGNLVDYLELVARSNPHGVTFTVRVPDEGDSSVEQLRAAATAKAKQLESLYE